MIKLSDVNFSIVQVSEKGAVPMPLLDMVNVSRRLRARTLLADLISCKDKAKKQIQQAFIPLFFVSLVPCLLLPDSCETLVRHMTNKRLTTVAQASGN